jgi:uncharacterized membrane protein YecN with MAPEG domain
MHITGLYAAICALLGLLLSFRVSLRRRAARVGLGHGGDEELTRRVRAQGNFFEYVPLALLLLLLLELDGARAWLLHLFGIVLVLARVLHAWGVSHSADISFGRFTGILGTWLVLLAMALLLLWQQALAWSIMR